MRVVQAVFGVFHHFELARELERRHHLERVFSTWPWRRLQREGLPHSRVETFPWLHVPEIVLGRTPFGFRRTRDALGYANALAFDRWMSARMPPCDVLIAISGAGLLAGTRLQQAGGTFICDRGSTHQRYQDRIVAEEYRRWGVELPATDERDTLREEAIYAAADAITVPSQAAARSFAQMGVPAEKLHIIPYGVRLENFYPVAEPAPRRFDLLFAGSAGLRKGLPYLLQAFAQLQHPAKRLRIAGAVHEDLQPLLAKLPQDHVEWLGPVPQSRLRELMSTSHALVLPSIEEGLALVQAQALACGCPVLCTTNTGGEDLFTNGIEGFVLPIRDPSALLGCMQRLADDPALAASMRGSALSRVRQIGGWNHYGDAWERLLFELTGSSAVTAS